MENGNESHLISILMKELDQVTSLFESGMISTEVHNEESNKLKEKIKLLGHINKNKSD